MKLSCENVRDVAPDLLMGRLSAAAAAAVREHVAGCPDCATELELARLVSRRRTTVPPGLHDRVVNEVTRRNPLWRSARARLAIAASIAILLLGGRGYMVARQNGPAAVAPSAGSEPAAQSIGPGWMTVESALMSGAASLGDLSEEQLRQLLTELES